jgi:hypothetical protein
MLNHVESIMTLLQKIYFICAGILFVLAVGGTVMLGFYIRDDCQSAQAPMANECVGLKVLLAFFAVGIVVSCGYILRVAWQIYKARTRARGFNYYDPLLGKDAADERIYAV